MTYNSPVKDSYPHVAAEAQREQFAQGPARPPGESLAEARFEPRKPQFAALPLGHYVTPALSLGALQS